MHRILVAAAGIAVVAAAVVVAVVASAAALFHTLQAGLGTAAAYGVVAAAAIVVAVIGVFAGKVKLHHAKPPPEPTLVESLGKIARERPILSAAGAIAAGIVALKNPSLLGAVLTSFMAGKSQGRDSRRR
jgi:hypothetical protein